MNLYSACPRQQDERSVLHRKIRSQSNKAKETPGWGGDETQQHTTQRQLVSLRKNSVNTPSHGQVIELAKR